MLKKPEMDVLSIFSVFQFSFSTPHISCPGYLSKEKRNPGNQQDKE